MPPKFETPQISLDESFKGSDTMTQVLTLIENIRTAGRNIKKVENSVQSVQDITIEVLQDRMNLFQTHVDKAQAIRAHLEVIATDEHKRDLDFFTKKEWKQFEKDADRIELWLMTELNTRSAARRRETLDAAARRHPEVAPANEAARAFLRLPKMELPSFDGTFEEWQPFHDLFKATVADHPTLSDATKMQYLKAALKGEAASLLSALPITDGNYRIAWNQLKERYENKRAQISHHLYKITNMQPVGQDALTKLRSIKDTLNLSIDSLRQLQVPADNWGPLLIHIAVQKFSAGLKKEWEKSLAGTNDYPTLQVFNEFLKLQMRILENLERDKEASTSSESPSKKKSAHNTTVKSSTASCGYCAEPHYIFQCEEFQALSLADRYKAQREKGLCANCLFKGHPTKDCRSKGSCRKCMERHHTLLHYDKKPNDLNKRDSKHSDKYKTKNKSKDKQSHLVNTEEVIPSEESEASSSSEEEEAENQVMIGLHSMPTNTEVLLATALVRVHSIHGQSAIVRALIDTGAETSFVSESLVQTLKLPRQKARVKITGLQGTQTGFIKYSTNLQFAAVHDGSRRFELQAYVLQHITNYKPKRFSPQRYAELEHLVLADPEPGSKLRIDVLLGADVLGQIMKNGILKLKKSKVTAQATHLGWILSGPVQETSVSHSIVVHNASVEPTDVLQKFWEMEDFPEPKPMSVEDQYCEDLFRTTTTRDQNGRYCVRLPFISEEAKSTLGESKSIAIASWRSVSKRLNEKPELQKLYNDFMGEYEELGHMQEIPKDDPNLDDYVFMPHHGVAREDSITTRLRVVFNASRQTKSGVTLNDVLCAGPKLQNDVSDVVTNWRRHPFVLKADMTKMFRQILIHPDDQKYQCIVHSDPLTNEIKFYKLLTVTYGTRPAPYLSNRVVKDLVEQYGEEFPLAVEPLDKCLYVDDALLGANTKEEAIEQRRQVVELLKRGCLELRKWSTNVEDLLPTAEANSSEFFIEPSGEENKSVLGIAWSPQKDHFSIKVKPVERQQITKRSILSDTARLYDPLGWLAPFVIRAKLEMQSLWLAKIDWDDLNLPDEVRINWHAICHEMPTLTAVSIPRFIGPGNRKAVVSLIGFSDASKRAYAAAVYLYVEFDTGEIKSNLIQAKSKVAPIKTVSIPRLELSGAVLLTKLMKRLQATWLDRIDRICCYTDSRIVLDWLAKHASHWHTFVANRVSFIQSTLPETSWQHIPGTANPADFPSRGLSAEDLVKSTIWWHGPDLRKLKKEEPSEEELLNEKTEVAREACHLISVNHGEIAKLPEYLSRFSFWPRLTRTIACCFKYLDILRERTSQSDRHQGAEHPLFQTYQRRGILQVEKTPWRQQTLSIDQIERAETHIHRIQQETAFAAEIATLKNNLPVSKGSYLKQLNPFLDDKEILRVGGRLQFSKLPWHHQHPIILPKDQVTRTLIRHFHKIGMHSGPQHTLTLLRERYWVVHGRNFVKQLLSKCVACVRFSKQTVTQLMAPLPPERCTQTPTFTHVGVDYTGPTYMKHGSGRGYQSHKVWTVIFVCFATRAIHLEIVDGYATADFMGAFKRFVARRGLPVSLWVDQGTNLQGACNELQRVFRSLTHNPEWSNYLAMQKIECHSIPPKGHHQGGIWEAAVKSFKHHFKRSMGDFIPSWDELTTIVCQIEACLNSRPVTPSLDRALDEPALTPGHFLMGRSRKPYQNEMCWIKK